MKRLLSILLFIPILGFSQYTAIPDQNFEQALIDLGHDDVLDGQVLTANISTIDTLNILSGYIVVDLTGIEDFTALTYLNCIGNELTSLDVSQNTVLTSINCAGNQLTSLDVSQNIELTSLHCYSNPFESLDVSNSIVLDTLICRWGGLESLNVTGCEELKYLDCHENQLNEFKLEMAKKDTPWELITEPTLNQEPVSPKMPCICLFGDP